MADRWTARQRRGERGRAPIDAHSPVRSRPRARPRRSSGTDAARAPAARRLRPARVPARAERQRLRLDGGSDATTDEILDAYADARRQLHRHRRLLRRAVAARRMIGYWMRERRNRDDLVIATKVGKSAEHPGLSAARDRGRRRRVTAPPAAPTASTCCTCTSTTPRCRSKRPCSPSTSSSARARCGTSAPRTTRASA